MGDSIRNLQEIEYSAKSLDEYVAITPHVVKEIQSIVVSLKGLKIAHLNTTAMGERFISYC